MYLRVPIGSIYRGDKFAQQHVESKSKASLNIEAVLFAE